MHRFIRRTVFLSFAILGMYLTFKDAGTLAIGEVAVRFSLVPFALAFFSITFANGGYNQKVALMSTVLFGLALTFIGFGFCAMGQIAGTVAGVTGAVVGIIGFIVIVCSVERLRQLR